eukprot:5570868-Amphidinium_carterae.2
MRAVSNFDASRNGVEDVLPLHLREWLRASSSMGAVSKFFILNCSLQGTLPERGIQVIWEAGI